MNPIKATAEMSDGMVRQETHLERTGGPVLLAGRSPGAFVFSSAFGPRITLAPADAPAPAPAPAPAASPAEPAPAPAAEPAVSSEPAPASPAAVEPAVRPEYIPEDFWDAEKGFKSEDFNALIASKAERDAQLAQVPATKEEYKVALPKDFKLPDGVELKEGESLIDESDPRIGALRDFAHSSQMSQAQFEGMIALGAQMDLNESASLKEAVGKQVELLGAKGKDRIAAVKSWVGAKLPADQAEALMNVMYTAKQVEAFEALMRQNRGAALGNPGAGRDVGKAELSDEEYNKMSPTARINYARQHSKT